MKKSKKAAALILSAAMALSASSALSVGASAEWVKTKDGYSYKDDGTGERLTGWQTVNGSKYYFNKQGTALTGWKIINGETYYFNGSKKGKMLTGWAKIKGKQYYFGSDGIMRKGWVKIKGSTYYFGSDGVMLTGTYKIDGKIYTLGADGRLTYTSAAIGCNVLTATNGITFHKSSVDEVYEMLPFDDEDKEASEEERILVFMPNENSIGLYMFGEDGTAYACMIIADGISKTEEARPFFTEAGWVLTDTRRFDNADVEMYVSPDKSKFGFVLTEDGSALVTVGGYEDIDQIYYGYFEQFD